MIVGSGQLAISDLYDGKRVARLTLYKWSATPPTVFPSGTSEYDWNTASYTLPTTPNGWTLTPGTPVKGQTLYTCSMNYVE